MYVLPKMQKHEGEGLEDLRRPILEALCIAGIGISWAWIAVVATLYEGPDVFSLLAPPASLLVASMVSLLGPGLPLYWRSMLFGG